MEFKEEPCRIKEEDTEEQIDLMELNEDKQHHFTNEDGKLTYKNEDEHLLQNLPFKNEDGKLTNKNEDKQHLLQKTKNEDGNATISKTEENFTQKLAGKSRVKKSLTCSECGKIFTYKSHFNRHMRIHTGEKPVTCSECGKSYTTKSELKRHTRIHTIEKMFTCTQCGKSCGQKSNLLRHMRIHTVERPLRALSVETVSHPKPLLMTICTFTLE